MVTVVNVKVVVKLIIVFINNEQVKDDFVIVLVDFIKIEHVNNYVNDLLANKVIMNIVYDVIKKVIILIINLITKNPLVNTKLIID